MAILRLFGGLSLEDDEGPISGRSAQRRRLALLALLAGSRRPLTRDKLVGYLWPESDSERARHVLSEALYVLRKVLGEEALLVTGDEVRLNGSIITTDLAEFDAALQRGDFAAAADLYAGPFLDGFFLSDAPEFERWAEAERERYQRQYLDALQRLATEAGVRGDREAAVRWWRRLAEHDPYSAPTALGLMAALDALGDRAGAIQFARVHAALLREDLDIEPAPEVQVYLQRLREPPSAPRVAAGDASHAPSAAPPSPPQPAPAPSPGAVPLVAADTRGPAPIAPHQFEQPGAVVPLAERAAPAELAAPPRVTASAPADRARPGSRSRQVVIGLALLLVIVGLPAAWVIWRDHRPAAGLAAAPGAGAAVAVLPFEAQGGAAATDLREGMVDLLSTALDGAAELRGVDPHAVLSAYAQLGLAAAGPREGAALAERLGARYYLIGSVLEAGDRLHFQARLYDRSSPAAPVAHASAQGRPDDLATLVDSLTAQLLVGRVREPADRLTKLAGLTTHSVPALKAYLQGEQHARLARYDRASDAFAHAVTLDSSFALAYYRLSAAAEWSFDFARAHRAAGRALAYGERLSEPDWRLLRAWSAFIEGDATEAERQYEELTTARRDYVEAWAGLGEVQAHYNAERGRSVREARAAFERALELGGNYGEVRFHLLELAAARRDSAGFHQLLAGLSPKDEQYLPWQAVRAFAWGTPTERDRMVSALARADEITLGIATARTATALQDFAAAERLGRLLVSADRPKPWRAAGHLMLAELALAQGRRRAAQAELATALPLEPAWTLELTALSTALPLLSPGRPELLAAREALQAWRPEQRPPTMTFFFGAHADAHALLRAYLLGLLEVQLGNVAEARDRLPELRRLGRTPDGSALAENLTRSLKARMAQRGGERSEAIALLRSEEFHPPLERIALSPIYSRALERFALAELLEEDGDLDEALRWFGSLSEGYDFLLAAPAQLREARLLERLGQPAQARERYAHFVRLWEHADPELQPAVTAARTQLARLAAAAPAASAQRPVAR